MQEKTVLKEPKDKKTKKKIPVTVLYAPALEEIITAVRNKSYPIASCGDLFGKLSKDSSSFRSILWYPEFGVSASNRSVIIVCYSNLIFIVSEIFEPNP